jgi:hypothetical protein
MTLSIAASREVPLEDDFWPPTVRRSSGASLLGLRLASTSTALGLILLPCSSMSVACVHIFKID